MLKGSSITLEYDNFLQKDAAMALSDGAHLSSMPYEYELTRDNDVCLSDRWGTDDKCATNKDYCASYWWGFAMEKCCPITCETRAQPQPYADEYFKRITLLAPPFAGTVHGGYALIGKLDTGEVLIGFAGTTFDNLKDLQADFASMISATVDLGGAQKYDAGSGFVAQYTELLDKGLHTQMEAHITQGTRVRVVGHSLGGALANLAAVECANMGAKVLLQTIGSPRVFDGGSIADDDKDDDKTSSAHRVQMMMQPWSTNMTWGGSASVAAGKILTQRLTQAGDLVTRVPCKSLGFKHVGNGGLYVYQPGATLLSCGECTWKIALQAQDFTPWEGFWTQHGRAKYRGNVKEALKNL